MKPFRGILWGLVFLLIGVFVVQAASLTCPTIVQAALAATRRACASTGWNQACYGSPTLQPLFRDGAIPVKFDQIGDRVSISNLRSLHLSPMNLTDNSWGIALMKIQANLPDAPPEQNVTFVMFGSVVINNTALPLQTVSLITTGNVNVLSRPSTQGAVVASLKPGTTVIANGRLADTSWLRLQLPDGSASGWVSASLLKGASDIHLLTVVDPAAAVYAPMQTFSFSSGVGATPCAEVPASGLLLQSPNGQKVNLMVNGAAITLDATAYLQAQPGAFMTITVVNGTVSVQANGLNQNIPAGESSRIPLDFNGTVSGASSSLQPYDPSLLGTLPLTLLPDTIVNAP